MQLTSISLICVSFEPRRKEYIITDCINMCYFVCRVLLSKHWMNTIVFQQQHLFDMKLTLLNTYTLVMTNRWKCSSISNIYLHQIQLTFEWVLFVMITPLEIFVMCSLIDSFKSFSQIRLVVCRRSTILRSELITTVQIYGICEHVSGKLALQYK